jgi:hypothetical protein
MRFQHSATHAELTIARRLFNENSEIDFKDLRNFAYLLAWAKMNGVLYALSLAMQKKVTHTRLKGEIEKVVENQREKAEELVAAAHALITLCEHHGLHLIPMKTFLQFPYVGDDLDIILVENERVARCRALLEEKAYRYLKSRSSLREPKKRFYFAPGVDNSGLRLHLHWAVSWNGVDYLDIKTVYKRRRQIQVKGHAIPIPSVEDEILIMAAHAVHENRYILLGEMIQLERLTQHGHIDWGYIVASAQAYNWLPGLYFFLALSNMIMQKLDREEPVPEKVLAALAEDGRALRFMRQSLTSWGGRRRNLRFPVIMPLLLTSFTFFYKYLADLKDKKKSLREMGRELLAYTLVDWAVFWRFGGELRDLNQLKQQKNKKI